MKSYWIWNYGDYEIYHTNLVNSRRDDYGMAQPPFWKMGNIEQNVCFCAEIDVKADGYFMLHLNGEGYIIVDGVQHKPYTKYEIKKGLHKLVIRVFNMTGLPAAFVESDVMATNGAWYSISPTVFAADESVEKYNKINVGFCECYDSSDKNPEMFMFQYERLQPVSKNKYNNGVLFDFGKEIFGYLLLNNAKASDTVYVVYGETEEEATDAEKAVLSETVSGSEEYKLRQRAFRYIYIIGCPDIEAEADYEYLPLDYKGSFRCSDETVNKIWDTCVYTLHLNAREVLLDGIKRDRWCWGGDVYQASKFCNYVFFDKDIVRRSIIGLRGSGVPTEFINTITDYSLYWIIGLWEYFFTFGDIDFLKFIYDRAVSMMDFIKTREDENGLIIKKCQDWIFIDWSDIDKTGAVCAEQMLYIAANQAMVNICEVLGMDGTQYEKKTEELTRLVNEKYWDDEKGAFIDSFESGKRNVTRHANIFAILYDIATDRQRKSIVENVLFNDRITKITTPYFEGFELDVMGRVGSLDYIEDMLGSYWQGMLDLGATTIWEEYNPELSGIEHYAMYDRKYEKSLCHAWGAAPIYLLGKYYLGVYPTSVGYETFDVVPNKGRFEYITGTVPIKDGEVEVSFSNDKLEVMATKPGGTLVWNNNHYKLNPNEKLVFNL